MDNEQETKLVNHVAIVASEAFRFNRMLEKAIKKLDFEDQKKVVNQYCWFTKKIDELINEAGLRTIIYEMVEYQIGLPVTPINIEEFETNDSLVIIYTIEPTILLGEKVIKNGTVVLGRKE